jgi:hypothetical protein
VDERPRRIACVPKRNRITSVAAIVAPQTCDLVRGAYVLEHARVPLTHLVFFAVFDLLPCPSRKCSSLYCLTFANPAAVQYRSREPATSSATGCGTKCFLIHLRSVPR